MNGARAQAQQRFAVRTRRVALVYCETVAGVAFVELAHDCVASNFRQDRGGRNGYACVVTAYDRSLLAAQVWKRVSAVNEDKVWSNRESIYRICHAAKACLADVHGVDVLRTDFGNMPCGRCPANGRYELLALDGREAFGVVDSSKIRRRGENHRCSDHGSRQRPATNLVNSSNMAAPLCPEPLFTLRQVLEPALFCL